MLRKYRQFFIKRKLVCDKCGKNKFKTVSKGKHYQCRACNHIITIRESDEKK